MADVKGPPYKSVADVPRGTPTPTQAELNKIAMGEQVELAADGSGPDPFNQPLQGTVAGVKPAPAPAAGHHEAATHGRATHGRA